MLTWNFKARVKVWVMDRGALEEMSDRAVLKEVEQYLKLLEALLGHCFQGNFLY